MRILLRNARLIDGTGRAAQDGAALLIEGDTIVHAGPLAAADAPGPDAALTLDLAGRTVIPGLVEAHLHLSYNDVKQIADLDLNCPPEYSTLLSAKNAELVLALRLHGGPLGRLGPRRRRGAQARHQRGALARARGCWRPAATSAPPAAWPTGTRPISSSAWRAWR